MIQFIAGEKGEGKTKRIIEMANLLAKTADGNLVFIDDDKRHIYDLHYDIRFVETANFPLSNYRELIGFICGILSMDHDIEYIFIDGLTNVVKNIDDESLIKLIAKLESLTGEKNLNFIITMNCKKDELPEEVKRLLVA